MTVALTRPTFYGLGMEGETFSGQQATLAAENVSSLPKLFPSTKIAKDKTRQDDDDVLLLVVVLMLLSNPSIWM